MIVVVVVGSSGGGAATLAHTDPTALLRTIQDELSCVDGLGEDEKIGTVGLFLSMHDGIGLDSIDDPSTSDAPCTLYGIGINGSDNMGDGNSTGTMGFDVDVSAASGGPSIAVVTTGPLFEVNSVYERLDRTVLAPAIIRSGGNNSVRGVVSVSSDPCGVNASSFAAAASRNLPVTGSGGTSLSAAAMVHGVRLVGNAGGSVATTTYIKAVSFVYALTRDWGGRGNDIDVSGAGTISYRPSSLSKKNEQKRPSLRSILDACLPAALAVAVACRILEEMTGVTTDSDSDSGGWEDLLQSLRTRAMPMVASVVAATSLRPEYGSTAQMAAAVASVSCPSSLLAGLLAGWMVAQSVGWVSFACIRCNVPATATDVICSGITGTVIAAILHGTGMSSLMSFLGNGVRRVVQSAWWTWISTDSFILNLLPLYNYSSLLSSSILLRVGPPAVLGCLFVYGSKVGWYHRLYLPVILLEMDGGRRMSAWGAIDQCTLVMVSAGICSAEWLWRSPWFSSRGALDVDVNIGGSASASPNIQSSATTTTTTTNYSSLWRRGVAINLLCGDFIEAAYPSMEASRLTNMFAYVAAGASTAILYGVETATTVTETATTSTSTTTIIPVLSSAYLPLVGSVLLSTNPPRMAAACAVAYLVSFVGCLLGNYLGPKSNDSKEENRPKAD